ncbi:MAG: RNA polymerase sigma factor [Cytophagaceae bacterium]|nr:RNA polymerase sigma factor [Cytophagaceae bacterium]
MTDEQLIEGCKQGKHAAFEALYKKYATRMMAIAQRYCNTTFEGEDILQDAFIKVFKKIDTFDSKGSFEGWLRRVVVNTSINHYHQTYKQKLNVDYDYVPDTENISPDAISKLSNEELLNVIQELPEGYRMVFNLYVMEGYTHKEIGDLLNINEGTSKSQLAKAKNMIRRLLCKYNIIANAS